MPKVIGITLNFYDTDGDKRFIVTQPKSLEITHRLNWFSTHSLALDYDVDPAALFATNSLVLDWGIEFFRVFDDIGQESVREYYGFHRTPQNVILENGEHLVWSFGRSPHDLLARRGIGYRASVQGAGASTYTLKSGPADDIMKEFVYENAGAGATSPPRLANGVTPGLLVAADAGVGPTWTGARALKNLLEVLRDIADESGVDFTVETLGPESFRFETGYPQLGTDRTATVKFSPDLGNMETPSYTLSRTEESNAIFILGPGQGSARHILVDETLAVSESPWNRCESFVEASGEQTAAGIIKAGDEALEERKAQESFAFRILQTDTLLYGRHYFLGDLVTVEFNGTVREKKVTGVTLRYAEGSGESVEVELSDPVS